MEPTGAFTDAMRFAFVLLPLLATAGVLTLAVGFRSRTKLSEIATVFLTCALTFFIVATVATGLYATGGAKLEAMGVQNQGILQGLNRLHAYISSQTHLDAREKFSVCVFGDSTHYYGLEVEDRMMPQLQHEYPVEYQNAIEWYGVYSLGLDAYDFFFLFNWLVKEKPDLLVIPLNLRAFGYNWVNTPLVLLPELERYVQIAEIPTAMRLSNQTHDLRWDHMLMRKLDYAIFKSRVGRFCRGTKLAFKEVKESLDTAIEEQFADKAAPLPIETIRPKPNFFQHFARRYEIDFSQGHSMLNVLKQLNRLAHENGVEVMYYTVQCEDKKVPQEEHFKYIQEFLLKDPGVRFVNLLGLVRQDQFSRQEHLKKDGIQVVASHLSAAIAEVALQRDPSQ